MARYRKNTAQVLFTDVFKGLDVTEGGKKNFSSSVYMKNFTVTPQFKLKKRCGYKKIMTGIHANSRFAGKVRGEDCFIYKDGKKLKAVRLTDMRLFSCDTGSTASVGYFIFGEDAYIYGRDFYYRFNGRGFERITPYIPTVAVSCSNDGSGTVYESLNIISDKAAVSYTPDGVSADFVLPDIAETVEKAELNGIELDSSTYEYDGDTRTLTLADTPPGDVPDSLKVTFGLSEGTMINMPFPGKNFCIYGGSRDTRVFAYGNGNILRYSDVTAKGADVTYFPADNFITVGDGARITALMRHYDRLMIFTERETWFLSPSSVNYEGYSKPAFPLSPLSSTVGCKGGGAAYADNAPLTLSGDGIYVFGRSTVRDERNAHRISDRVSPYVTTAFLSGAAVYDCEYAKEIWMCFDNAALIYNYGIDAFYYYDGIPAEYVFEANGKVAFYDGGSIFVFDESCKTDDGAGINAVYESGAVTLDPTAKKRRLRRVCLSFLPNTAVRANVFVIPNRGEPYGCAFSAAPSSAGMDFNRIDFGSFTFGCVGKSVHGRCRARLSSFENLKIRIECGENGGGLSVDSVSLTVDGT